MKLSTTQLARTLFLYLGIICFPAYSAGFSTDLWMTKTAGIWEKGTVYGFYQVQVYRTGIEHPIDTIEIKEIQIDEKKQKKSVLNTYKLNTPGIKAYVHDVNMNMIDEKRMLLYLELEMKAMEGAILREVYLLGPDGKHELIEEAQYRDLSR